jgi:endogenous inhibitor of DNA gyrase (YacG/DUF329 family)
MSAYKSRDVGPCYGCPDRYPACSAYCKKPEYLNWRAEQEVIKENRRAYDKEKQYEKERRQRYRRKERLYD